MAAKTIKCWEVLINVDGTGGYYSHYGYYETQTGAESATKKFEKQNNYYPSWRIEEKVITIEQGP